MVKPFQIFKKSTNLNSREAQRTENTVLEENKIIGTNFDDEISKIQKLKDEGKKDEIEKLIESN
ncbi:MAG: hypothetical protein WC264_00095 [Candidatus Paceibacterota bacterium]|jgi:hypothetical protein